MFLIFRPAIIHAYSSIMGYLDMDGCVPFDLLLQDSAYKLGCMNCNKETKVDVSFVLNTNYRLLVYTVVVDFTIYRRSEGHLRKNLNRTGTDLSQIWYER